MTEFCKSMLWPTGLLAVSLIAPHVWDASASWFDANCGATSSFLCIPVSFLLLVVWLIAAPAWILHWLINYLFGLPEGTSLVWLTLLAVASFVACWVGANPGKAFDASTSVASYGVRSGEKPSPQPSKSEKRKAWEETRRQSARAEMEEAIRNHEKAKARLEALQKKHD